MQQGILLTYLLSSKTPRGTRNYRSGSSPYRSFLLQRHFSVVTKYKLLGVAFVAYTNIVRGHKFSTRHLGASLITAIRPAAGMEGARLFKVHVRIDVLLGGR